MSNGAMISFAPLVFKSDHFVGLELIDNLGCHRGALDQGRARPYLFAIGMKHNVRKSHFIAGLSGDFLYGDRVSRTDPELLSP